MLNMYMYLLLLVRRPHGRSSVSKTQLFGVG